MHRTAQIRPESTCVLLVAVLLLAFHPLRAQTGKTHVGSVASTPDGRTFVVTAHMLQQPEAYVLHLPASRCRASRTWKLVDAYGRVVATMPKATAGRIRMDGLPTEVPIQPGYFTWRDCEPAPSKPTTVANRTILSDESETRLPRDQTSGGPSAVVDVNGDDIADVVRTAPPGIPPFSHSVLVNRGDGVFDALDSAFPSELDTFGIRDLIAADIDRDDDVDLVVVAATESAPLAMYKLTNDGNGRFDLVEDGVLSAVNGFRLSADDLNADDYPDLIVTCLLTCAQVLPTSFDETPIALLMNTGEGGFTVATMMLEPDSAYGTVRTTTTDIDADGRPDIVLSNQYAEFHDADNNVIGTLSGQDALLRQTGDGRFVDETVSRRPQTSESTAWTLAADFDDDQDSDLYVLEGMFLDLHTGVVLSNDGTGHFSVIQSDLLTAGPANGLASADIDGDAMVDVAFLSMSQLIILRNDGGVPAVFEDVSAQGSESWIGLSLGDVDGDQDPDFFVSAVDAPDRLFINTTFRPTDVSREQPAGGFALEGLFPNPATSKATLVLTLDKPADIQIRVVDMLGRQVRASNRKWITAGRHTEMLDATGLVAGMYVILIDVNRETIGSTLTVQ